MFNYIMEGLNSKPLSSLIFLPLLALICIRPFFSGLLYPTFEFYYENIAIFLAILTIFFSRARLKNPYNIPFLLLLLSYLASTAFSVNLQNSIKETTKFISYISIFLVVYHCNKHQKGIIIKGVVLAAVIISVYSIYQYFWGYERTLMYLKKTNSDFLATSSYAKDILLARRAIGTFPSPNILGGYLILAFFLSLTYIQPRRLPTATYAVTIASALILTKSLGVWLSLIAALVALFILYYKIIGKQKLIAALCLILFISALAFILATRWERLINVDNPQNSITQRLNYWRTAIAVIKDHPIIGVGPANFQEVFLKYKVGTGTDTRYAHNILLHQWAETGILGLIGIFYLIIGFFRKLIAHPREGFIFYGGLAFILHNLIDNTYFIPEAGFLWWVLVAVLSTSL